MFVCVREIRKEGRVRLSLTVVGGFKSSGNRMYALFYVMIIGNF